MVRDDIQITVFTPTFNRSHTLPRLAESLRSQVFRKFEWLVVDDGSTDGTETLIQGFQSRGDFPIRLIKTENGGKHRAINIAAREARGDWFFIVDSDDWLPPESLERIARCSSKAMENAECCGIMGLREAPDGHVIGSRLPDNGGFHDTLELHYRLGVKGDKAEVFKTDHIRRFPFPEFQGEKFVTEALVWNRMASKGLSFLVADEILYTCEYQADGLSASSVRLRIRNPRGNLLYYAELLAYAIPFRAKVRLAINFGRFALLCSSRPRFDSAVLGKYWALVIVLLPVAFLLALKDRAASKAFA